MPRGVLVGDTTCPDCNHRVRQNKICRCKRKICCICYQPHQSPGCYCLSCRKLMKDINHIHNQTPRETTPKILSRVYCTRVNNVTH